MPVQIAGANTNLRKQRPAALHVAQMSSNATQVLGSMRIDVRQGECHKSVQQRERGDQWNEAANDLGPGARDCGRSCRVKLKRMNKSHRHLPQMMPAYRRRY
jgi:hypothetical protein